MAHLCTICSSIDIASLFLNDFCSLARALSLVTDIEEDDVAIAATGERVVVSRQREDILSDVIFDSEAEKAFLSYFLDVREYLGERDGRSIRKYLETYALKALKLNGYAQPLGRISELSSRAKTCTLCAVLTDTRLWRLLDSRGEHGDSSKDIAAATSNDYLCYLFPVWPYYKIMWHDYFTTPNELYVLVVPSADHEPPDAVHDALLDRSRDLRILCLFDHPRGIWQSRRPQINWRQVKEWLPETDSDDDDLTELGSVNSKTFMLINVRKSRIEHFASLNGICYAALSYVWGAARTSEKWCRDIQTLHDRNQTQPVGVVFDTLPQTLRDALIICQALEIPYLWIDSLCIAQNLGVEKSNAIADMGYIYRACHLCIVAAAGGVHDHLPGVSISRSANLVVVQDLNIGVCPPPLRETVHQSKWNSRGWCFQESTLAPRCLVVLQDQVFMQTGSTIMCEYASSNIGNNYDDPSSDYKEEPLTTLALYKDTSEHAAFSVYKDMVANYSRRELSFEVDGEDAFCGLSRTLEAQFKFKMLKGLPLTTLAKSLNWFCPNTKTWGSYEQVVISRQTRRRLDGIGNPYAPSWSWLSRVGQVEYTTIPDTPEIHIAECLEGIDISSLQNEVPADGFEWDFSTKPTTNGQYRYCLDSPLILNSKIHNARFVRLVDFGVKMSDWLQNLSQHRYILDDGGQTKLTSEPYILPLVYETLPGLPESLERRSNKDAKDECIAAALIVELFEYSYALRDAFSQPLKSVQFSRDGSSRAKSVGHILTSEELRTKVYVARRIGAVPYGLARLKVQEDSCLDATVVLLA